jgi:hypothetical protein
MRQDEFYQEKQIEPQSKYAELIYLEIVTDILKLRVVGLGPFGGD